MRRITSPHFVNLFQFATTLLIILYMLFIGGSFDAIVRFRTQLLNAVGASAIAITWLIFRWRLGKSIKTTGLEVPLTIFLFAQIISTLASPQIRLSADGFFVTLDWVIMFFVLRDLLAHTWRIDFVINSLMFIAGIIVTDGLREIANWYIFWIQLGQLPATTFRLDGFLGHANLTTATINLLLPLVIMQIIVCRNWLTRSAFIFLAFSSLLIEFFASSRAGWIASVISLSIMGLLLVCSNRKILFSVRENWRDIPLIYRSAIFVVTIGIALVFTQLLIRQTQHGTHSPDIIASRQGFWESAWKLFLSQPLTGLGPGTFSWFYPLTISVPPTVVLPHAHSLIFQILAEGGVIGIISSIILIVVSGQQLWQRWRTAENKAVIAALIGSISGAVVHHLFDYFFNAPIFTFLFIIVCALAFTSSLQSISFKWIALPVIASIVFNSYSMIGLALNSQGVDLALRGKWQEAAPLFQRATEVDPGMPLYWEHTTQAYARLNDIHAISFAQRAIKENPQSALDLALAGLLSHDINQLKTASKIAPQSKLIQINLGWLAEQHGDSLTAQESYSLALANGVSPDALFWDETSLRSMSLSMWKLKQLPNQSVRERAWVALNANDLSLAIKLFEQEREENPISNDPYVGLARAYIALGDLSRAKEYERLGFSLYTSSLSEQLDLYILRGDIALLEKDRNKAKKSYTLIFNSYNDYTSAGLASYGYPWHVWITYRRESLPSDLAPQFIRADITPEIEKRFMQLAQLHFEDGEKEIGCLILARIYREASSSKSGVFYNALCK